MEFKGYLFNSLDKLDCKKLTKTQSLFKDGVIELNEIGENSYLIDYIEPNEFTGMQVEEVNGQLIEHFDTEKELALAVLNDDESSEFDKELAHQILGDNSSDSLEEEELEEELEEPLIWIP
ncbi:hypothetical protein [Synechococcus sp. PCC 6312]|uniref:hypothetical protein n=1 Tax=Synechococcus sp. (strain ATCC 27167 / PCC 6312) TaxID=195253 RepID=UPI00029F2CD4|nr:hypothetical protein [Synechococcus sp. PCC 6312]AFY60529.1 hypothetical protein Syn6312_1358 [Synechococcus sp. PCC 6312]